MDTENKNDKVVEKAQTKSRNKFNKKTVIKWLHFFIEGENLLWSIAFVVYFCFHSFFENIISKYFVEPFFSTFQDTVITSLLTIAVGLIVITKPLLRLYHNYEKGDSISVSSFYPWGLLLLLYIYYRAGDVWVFYGIFGCEHVFYSDIFFLIFIAVIASKISLKKKAEEPQNGKAFSIDNPITNTGEDLLGRAPFAESLANKVFDTPTTNGAFTVGVVAPWGYGKTSFLNIMKDCLSRKGAIAINFSPWLYGEDNNLTKAFFAELNKYLKVYNRALSEKLILYAELLESTELPYMKFFSKLLKQGYKQSLDSLRCDLEKALKAITTPIVVIIDDVDRLGAKEIIEVMKIIRNSANFANIRFVAAYDRDYVANAIRSLTAPENYLEKIFQVEYVLPNFDKNKLSGYLKEQLSFVEEQEELRECLTSGKFAIEELTNLRDVKRFVNMFQMVYLNLKGEIVLVDLMNLIILKQKYFSVYSLFANSYKQLLFIEYYRYVLFNREKHSNKKVGSEIVNNVINDKIRNDHKDINENWDSFFQGKYNEVQKTRIIYLLNKLFTSNTGDENKSINRPLSIGRYFYDTLLDEDFSILKFKDLIKKDYTDFMDGISKSGPTKVRSLIKLLSNYEFNNESEYEKILNALLYCGDMLKDKYVPFEEITRFLAGANKSNEKETYKNILIQTLNKTIYSMFTAEYLQLCDFRNYTDMIGLSDENNLDIRLNLLKNAIDKELKLNEIKKYMYFARKLHLSTNGYFSERNHKVNEIFVERYAKSHPIEVITDSIRDKISDGQTRYEVSYFIEDVWESWDAYEQFLKDIKLQDEKIKEYLEFFEAFKSNTYKDVLFNFKYIQINKTNIHPKK